MLPRSLLYKLNFLCYIFRETEGDDYNEEKFEEAMSSQQLSGQEESDHSDDDDNDNAVLKEYELDTYDEDGDGRELYFKPLPVWIANKYQQMYQRIVSLPRQ